MSDTATELQEAGAEVAARVAATIRKLRDYHQVSNGAIGSVIGLQEHQVQERLSTGAKPAKISASDLYLFARAFGVEIDVLFLSPEGAVAWSIENNAEPLFRSRWFSPEQALVDA